MYASPPPSKKIVPKAKALAVEPQMKAMAPSEAAKEAKEITPVSDGEIIHPIVRDVAPTEPPK